MAMMASIGLLGGFAKMDWMYKELRREKELGEGDESWKDVIN